MTDVNLFDVTLNSEKLGIGLSKGELIQWLLDLSLELNNKELSDMKEDFDCSHTNFEDFLYEQKGSDLIKISRFKNEEYIVIEKHDPFSF